MKLETQSFASAAEVAFRQILCMFPAAPAACKPSATRNSLRAENPILFLDKRQELCGEESLYSEKNC